jgi:hypothetical protein
LAAQALARPGSSTEQEEIMSDDSDALIAAAAIAAVVTWVGTRGDAEKRSARPQRRDWPALLRAFKAGAARSWRETPCYVLFTALRDAFFRKR